jgi:hypothetical protein
MALDDGLIEADADDDGACASVEVAEDGADLNEGWLCARDEDRLVPSRDALRCSYTRAKIMASSKEPGCCSATSVRSGSPKPVMKS